MEFPEHLDIVVASDDGYERVFAELSWDDSFIGFIHQDLGRARPQFVYGDTYEPVPKIEVPVDWFLDAIQITTDELVGDLSRDTPIPHIIEPEEGGKNLVKHKYQVDSYWARSTKSPDDYDPKQLNAEGVEGLEQILNHPEAFVREINKRFDGPDIYIPNGHGARFDNKGSFKGFLEPIKPKLNHLRIVLARDPQYKHLIAELYRDEGYLGYIHQDYGKSRLQFALGDTVLPHPRYEVPVGWFLEAIRITSKHLVSNSLAPDIIELPNRFYRFRGWCKDRLSQAYRVKKTMEKQK